MNCTSRDAGGVCASRDRASTFVLGLADIAPASAPSLSVNLEVRAGYVIDLSDTPRELKVVP